MSQTSVEGEGDWHWALVDGIYVLSGVWGRPEMEHLQSWSEIPPDGEITLQLEDVDIVSGPAMALCITWIRSLCQRHPKVTLIRAPQMLAHTLYKTNMLNTLNIVLISPREDSGIGI